MPDLNIQFQGQTLILPGAYYADNVGVVTAAANVPPVIVVGFGYGVQPLTPTSFTSLETMQTAVRGGPVSAYLPFLFSPSGQLNGASLVTFINVGENTQSTYTLKNNSAVNQIVLTSANYGAPSNLLQVSVSAGTIGGYNIEIFDGYADTTAVGYNLGLPMQIAYTGSASGVTASITQVASGATQLVLSSPNPGESVTIPFGTSTYATVTAVAEYINGTGFYLAEVISDGALPSTSLDAVTSLTLPAPVANVPQYKNITATLTDPIFWFNQYASSYATAALASGAASTSSSTLAVIPLTHFTGGTNVPPITSDYANGFNVALTVPGWTVFADSNSLAVQALGAQHALTASSIPNRKPRRFITGSSIGDTVTTTLSNILQLNEIQATYCYPGITATSTVTGLNTTYGGLYVAAAVAGMLAGNPVSTALTNKSLTGTGVEQTLTTAQINQLQQGGCMPIALNAAGVPIVVSDFTCWQNDSNPENVFNQQVGIRQYLEYLLIQTAQPYVGGVASSLTLGLVRAAIVTALNQQIYSPVGNTGCLNSWDTSSLTLVYTGSTQSLSVQVAVTPVGQFRFILISVQIDQLNLAA